MILNEMQVINGALDRIWRIAVDVDNWTAWDPHEKKSEIYGPFAVGTKGYSKPRGGPEAHWIITDVEFQKQWSLLNKMPIGSLAVTNSYEKLAGEKVRCGKKMVVSGLILNLLFWIHFAKVTRRDMHETWEALEKHANSPSSG